MKRFFVMILCTVIAMQGFMLGGSEGRWKTVGDGSTDKRSPKSAPAPVTPTSKAAKQQIRIADRSSQQFRGSPPRAAAAAQSTSADLTTPSRQLFTGGQQSVQWQQPDQLPHGPSSGDLSNFALSHGAAPAPLEESLREESLKSMAFQASPRSFQVPLSQLSHVSLLNKLKSFVSELEKKIEEEATGSTPSYRSASASISPQPIDLASSVGHMGRASSVKFSVDEQLPYIRPGSAKSLQMTGRSSEQNLEFSFGQGRERSPSVRSAEDQFSEPLSVDEAYKKALALLKDIARLNNGIPEDLLGDTQTVVLYFVNKMNDGLYDVQRGSHVIRIQPLIRTFENKVLVDFDGGHLAGRCKTLESLGLVKILKEGEERTNGCVSYELKNLLNSSSQPISFKTEFPKNWSADYIVNVCNDVLNNKAITWSYDKGQGVVQTTINNVEIRLVRTQAFGPLVTAYPIIRNICVLMQENNQRRCEELENLQKEQDRQNASRSLERSPSLSAYSESSSPVTSQKAPKRSALDLTNLEKQAGFSIGALATPKQAQPAQSSAPAQSVVSFVDAQPNISDAAKRDQYVKGQLFGEPAPKAKAAPAANVPRQILPATRGRAGRGY